jgi:hypothetical protein
MNIGYIIKLWLSVIIVTPVFILIPLSFSMGIYLYAVIFGAALSFPFFIVMMLLSLFIDNYIKDRVILKACYIILSLIGMTATLYITLGRKFSLGGGGGGFGDFLIWYGISILIFGLIYKVKTETEVPKEEEST